MSALRDSYDHLIVGGGVAADKTARAIRDRQPEATIAILSADADDPVYRPALTKDLWLKDDPDPASQDLNTAADTGSDLVTDLEVTSINPEAHHVTTAAGDTVGYGRLLLATGSRPRRFGGIEDERVVYLRTVADYRQLRGLVGEGTRVAVVGGGYIGTEIAAGLSTTGADVTVYFRGGKLMEHMFPPAIVDHLGRVFTAHGIDTIGDFELDSLGRCTPRAAGGPPPTSRCSAWVRNSTPCSLRRPG